MNRKLRILHRYLGAFAAFFIGILTITGLLLNHTENLQLDEKPVTNTLLLSWYGIEPNPVISYQVDSQTVSFDGLNIYLNTEKVGNCDKLTGAIQYNELLYISCEKQLMLMTDRGQLIESIDHLFGLPTPVDAIGTHAQGVFIKAGGQRLALDSNTMNFSPMPSSEATKVATITRTPVAIETYIQKHAQAHGLHMERLLQDIHSGRILGRTGVLLMDAAAILLVFMAFSGLWVWLKRR